MIRQNKQKKANTEKIYDRSRGPKYDLIAKWIGSNKRILDVGCGSGEFSRRLYTNGNHVTGIEPSEENYKIAAGKIKVYYGDFSRIEIKDGFDIVLFGDVLEHMLDPERAIGKAKELAREMILCVPNFDFWGVKVLKFFGINKMKSGILDENHVYSFNRRKIEEMIVDNGFKILDFASPAPRRFPGFYNHIIQLNPAFFGYQFIYRCKVVE